MHVQLLCAQRLGSQTQLLPATPPTSGLPPFFFLLLCFFSGAGAAAAAGAAPPSPPAAAPPSPTVRLAIAPDTPASREAFHRLYSSLSLGRKSLNSEGTPAQAGMAAKGREHQQLARAAAAAAAGGGGLFCMQSAGRWPDACRIVLRGPCTGHPQAGHPLKGPKAAGRFGAV